MFVFGDVVMSNYSQLHPNRPDVDVEVAARNGVVVEENRPLLDCRCCVVMLVVY